MSELRERLTHVLQAMGNEEPDEDAALALNIIRAAIADDPQLLTELGCEHIGWHDEGDLFLNSRPIHDGMRLASYEPVFRVLGVQAATP